MPFFNRSFFESLVAYLTFLNHSTVIKRLLGCCKVEHSYWHWSNCYFTVCGTGLFSSLLSPCSQGLISFGWKLSRMAGMWGKPGLEASLPFAADLIRWRGWTITIIWWWKELGALSHTGDGKKGFVCYILPPYYYPQAVSPEGFSLVFFFLNTFTVYNIIMVSKSEVS